MWCVQACYAIAKPDSITVLTFVVSVSHIGNGDDCDKTMLTRSHERVHKVDLITFEIMIGAVAQNRTQNAV